MIRYVTNADGDGWLSVVPDGVDPAKAATDPSRRLALPQQLKLDVFRVDKDREYFEILEGPNKGRKASVKLGSGGKSYLSASSLPTPPALVKINRTLQQLWFGSRGPFSAFTDPRDPVPVGSWDLEIPDAPHDSQDGYRRYSTFYRTWFRILSSTTSDRYLHLGVISHGCVTARPWITERSDPRLAGKTDDELGLPIPPEIGPKPPPTPWSDLYSYLITARMGAKAVGTLHVTDA